MSGSELPIERLEPLWRNETDEKPTTIDIDTRITEFTPEDLTTILQIAHSEPSYFNDFEVTFRTEGIAEQPIIRLGNGLQKVDEGFVTLQEYLEEEDAEVPRWEQYTSELIEGDGLRQLSEYLIEWSTEWSFYFHIDCILDKSEIGVQLRSEVAPDLPLALSIWSRKQKMEGWIESHQTDFQEIVHTLFPVDESPVFVFLDQSGDSVGDSSRFYSAEQFLETELTELESLVRQYFDWIDRDRDLTESGPNLPVITPSLFTSEEERRLFDTVFLFGVFAAVSQRVRRTGERFEFRIISKRNSISDDFTGEELSTIAESYNSTDLTSLYKFYERFIERGARETYRKLWQRSIVSECETFTELAEKSEDIIQTYEFFEEEAIEANFDDLSDAIQDAHTFTADITTTISNRTTRLTAEIQKVVITLLGAVFANVFLVLRWSNIDTILPFSIFVTAGILGFYFPTIQARVDELDDMIKENNSDFEVYSDTIQEFSNHLFDFSHFEDRRRSYVQYAERRKETTENKLETIFTGLSLVWLLFAIISIIYFDIYSRQFIVAILSLLPASLIIYYHRSKSYYPNTLTPLFTTGPSPMTLLLIFIILSAAFKLLNRYSLLPIFQHQLAPLF